MLKKINKTEELRSQLLTQGKVTTANSAEHRAATKKLNEGMKKVKRDFKVKEKKSEASASYICLTD